MTSDKAERFIRVNYDDSQDFPWVVMWGEGNVWSYCRTREHALKVTENLHKLCDVFRDFVDM